MSNERHEIVQRIIKLSVLHRVLLRAASSESPVYPGQLPILFYAMEHEGCSQKEIADHMHVSPASVALSTKRLQKAGMLKKTADEDDLRCNRISITKAGREAVQLSIAQHDHLDEKMTRGFNAEELEVLRRFIDRLIDNLQPAGWEGYDLFDYLALAKEQERRCACEEEEAKL